ARVPSARTAKVLDIGRLVTGSPFAVLEKLPGWTLAEVLRVRGPLPIAEAAEYVVQACRAIADARAVGIRRVGPTPSNLVLTRDANGAVLVKTVLFGANNVEPEEILLADFFREDGFEARRRLLPYVAPEHVRQTRRHDDPAADVWALGT